MGNSIKRRRSKSGSCSSSFHDIYNDEAKKQEKEKGQEQEEQKEEDECKHDPTAEKDSYCVLKTDNTVNCLQRVGKGEGEGGNLFHPLLFCNDRGDLDLYCCGDDNEFNKLNHVPKAHKKGITCSAYNASTKMVYTGSRDLDIKQWKLENGSLQPGLTIEDPHELTVTGIATTTDGTVLASGSRDNTVCFWDSKTGKQVGFSRVSRNIVTCMEFLSYKNVFIQGSEDLCLRAWDHRTLGRTKTPVQEFRNGYTYFPLCIASPGSIETDNLMRISIGNENAGLNNLLENYIFTGSKGFNKNGAEGKLWDYRKPDQVVYDFVGHEQDVVGCEFASDRIVVTASKDGTLRSWDIHNGNCLSKLFISTSLTCLSMVKSDKAKDNAPIFCTSNFTGECFLAVLDDGILKHHCKNI